VYPADFVLDNDYETCLNTSAACKNESLAEEIEEQSVLERYILLHYYGQVLVSQFVSKCSN